MHREALLSENHTKDTEAQICKQIQTSRCIKTLKFAVEVSFHAFMF